MQIQNRNDALRFVAAWKKGAPPVRCVWIFGETIQSQKKVVAIMRTYPNRYAAERIQGHLDAIDVLTSALAEVAA